MSILKRIFARPDDATKIIDGAVSGLDKIFFTKEERADANEKLSEWYLRYLAATEGQNLARRFIAIMVVALWIALIITGVCVRYFSVEYSEFIFRILVEVVMQPFSIIIAFYFLTHAVRTYRNGTKDN